MTDKTNEKKLRRVFLGVPCTETVRTEFAQAFAGMCHYNAQKLIHSPSCFLTGSVLHDSRNKIVKEFLNTTIAPDFDWLVFIDSDMAFPNNAVEQLLSHSPNVKIVGANYCSRIEPHDSTAAGLLGPVYTKPDSKGLEKVERMGMGLVAIHKDVFNALEMPYFDWVTGEKAYVGEDVYFFNRARQAGFDVYIDHDLSKDVYHMGSIKLSNDIAFRMAIARAQQASKEQQ